MTLHALSPYYLSAMELGLCVMGPGSSLFGRPYITSAGYLEAHSAGDVRKNATLSEEKNNDNKTRKQD